MSQVSTAQQVPSVGNPAPVDLSPIELQVFIAYLMGWPHWRIAMQTGISESAVAATIKRSNFQAAIAQATANAIAHGAKIATKLALAAEPALDRILYLMDNAKNENVQMRTAFDILDRAGYKPVEKSETLEKKVSVGFNIGALEPEDRERLRDIALRAARANVLGASAVDDAIDMTGAFERVDPAGPPLAARAHSSPPTLPPTANAKPYEVEL